MLVDGFPPGARCLAVEAGDRRQASGHGGTGPAVDLGQFPGVGVDMGPVILRASRIDPFALGCTLRSRWRRRQKLLNFSGPFTAALSPSKVSNDQVRVTPAAQLERERTSAAAYVMTPCDRGGVNRRRRQGAGRARAGCPPPGRRRSASWWRCRSASRSDRLFSERARSGVNSRWQ